jgi:hypothetical protein
MDSQTQFYISLGAQLVGIMVATLYAHLQLRSSSPGQPELTRRPRQWPFILAVLVSGVIAWSPLLFIEKRTNSANLIMDYGIRGPYTFGAIIDGRFLTKYRQDNNLILIVRFDYSSVDRMSDLFIEKTTTYTIEDNPIATSVMGRLDPIRLRISPGMESVSVEYNAAIIPKSKAIEDVKSLSDVSRIGGVIVERRLQTIPFSSLGIALSPRSRTGG